jgi:hypothetical protein
MSHKRLDWGCVPPIGPPFDPPATVSRAKIVNVSGFILIQPQGKSAFRSFAFGKPCENSTGGLRQFHGELPVAVSLIEP